MNKVGSIGKYLRSNFQCCTNKIVLKKYFIQWQGKYKKLEIKPCAKCRGGEQVGHTIWMEVTQQKKGSIPHIRSPNPMKNYKELFEQYIIETNHSTRFLKLMTKSK